jgi:hypothetical protein
VAIARTHLSSLVAAPSWRHHLRPEPDAGMPLARIPAGGYEQSWFLQRLRVQHIGLERPMKILGSTVKVSQSPFGSPSHAYVSSCQ